MYSPQVSNDIKSLVARDTEQAITMRAMAANTTLLWNDVNTLLANNGLVADEMEELISNSTELQTTLDFLRANDYELVKNIKVLSAQDEALQSDVASLVTRDTELALETEILAANCTQLAKDMKTLSSAKSANDVAILATKIAALVANDVELSKRIKTQAGKNSEFEGTISALMRSNTALMTSHIGLTTKVDELAQAGKDAELLTLLDLNEIKASTNELTAKIEALKA